MPEPKIPHSKQRDEDFDTTLLSHLRRQHYEDRHGPWTNIEKAVNLLDQPVFRIVTFEDGCWMTFCLGFDGTFVWRHRGGERYGLRKEYEKFTHNGPRPLAN